MIVIKIGGGQGIDPTAVCHDIAQLVCHGEKVVLVHGGSHQTNLISTQLGHPPRFVTSVSGYVSRYNDRETVEIFAMVTAGHINKALVAQLQQLGVNAIGLSGIDGRLLQARRKTTLRILENGRPKVLRGEYSGQVEQVNGALLNTLLAAGYTPVLAPLAISEVGEVLNVDGDRVAAAVGAALNAQQVVILSNVPGLLRDPADHHSLISTVPLAQVQDYLERYAQGRMKIKLLGAMEALQAGAGQVVIADGRVSRPLASALAGSGTVIQ